MDAAPCHRWMWGRFIDDVFFIWTRDEDKLHTFINHINSFRRNIKFTSEISPQQVNFLDVSIHREHDSLITDLYTEPTDTHQYLHSASCHPRHFKNGIAYSQALRFRRIYSNDSDFSHHTHNLKMRLVSVDTALRKYNKPWIELVLSLNPLAWNRNPTKMPPNPEPSRCHFSPQPPPLRNVTNNNHHILHTSGRLERVVPEAPVLAYMLQLPWLNRTSQSPSLTNKNSSSIQHGNLWCGTNRWVVCKDQVKEGDTVSSHSNNTYHHIRGKITCLTSNVIYLISCRVFRIQYVGDTRTTLKRCLYGHRSTVNTEKLDTPAGHHFNLPNHSITYMILQGIESLR